MALKYANCDPSTPPQQLGPNSTFTLIAKSDTDIWRKPPSTDVFNAPIIYKSLPISSFRRARITVSANWTTLYDQGGLLFVIPGKSDDDSGSQKRRWIKTGIEFCGGRPCMSVVVADHWADWGLSSLPEGAGGKVTVEIERDGKEMDGTMRVLVVGEDQQKTPVREVTSVFWDVDESQECWVGAYAAKPSNGGSSKYLEVTFTGFEIETAGGRLEILESTNPSLSR
jgi:regulation of enolase protein 1 (concanavalin A-like superfamily)